MEPRPQSSRSAHDQPSPRQAPAGAGRGPQDTGAFPQQPDPTMVVAPPRSDYDYSPLDLAPPGQRRRRQLVAAALGGLVVVLLVAAAVFAYLVLNEDEPEPGDAENIAAAQTEVAGERATVSARETSIAQAVGGTVTPEGETQAGEGDAEAPTEPAGEQGGEAEGTTTVDEGGADAAANPTEASITDAVGQAIGGGGPSEEELMALLPAQDVMPQGLTAGEDVTRNQTEVAAAIGGNREAETNLQEWGWTGNVERSFTAADPAALAPDATTDITVSLHGFRDDAAAAEALVYFSDVLIGLGYEEVEVGDIGATNRMLLMPQEDGGTTAALYVQEGPVLYRIGGYSPGGDPTSDVLDLAEALIYD